MFTLAICNHDVPTYRPTTMEFQDLTTFVSKGYDDHAIVIVSPLEPGNNFHLMKKSNERNVVPFEQPHKKMSEGVNLNLAKKISPVKINRFEVEMRKCH